MSNKFDRRQFLGTTAVTTAGLTVAGKLAQASTAANRKVVVGVMWAQRGRSLANTFSKTKDVVVKYICDVDEQRANNGANFLNKSEGNKTIPIFDFQKILDDKEVDALVCAAPNHWHGPATILGCSAGKHVYVEKPCSHNPAEGEMMIAAARKNKRCVQMGTQRRSAPAHIEAIQKIRDGVIGRVYSARSFYSASRGPIGTGKPAEVPKNLNYDLWQGPAPRKPYIDNLVHYNWHWRWHWGNGELGNNGVHSLDLCRWGLGVEYPERVVSSGDRYRFDDDQETPDTHVVAFEFGDIGQITWQALSCNRHHFPFAIFFGEKGTLEMTNAGYIIYDHRDKKIGEGNGSQGQPEHIQNFVDAIRSDDPTSLNQEIESGHKSTLLCHLGNIAQRTGKTITCDPKNGHILDNPEAMEKYWKREYEKGWEPKV